MPSPRASFLHKLSSQVERNQNTANALTTLQFALTSRDTKKFGSITHLTPAEIQYAANTLAKLQHNILLDSDLPVIANITNAILRSSLNKTNYTIVRNNMALVVTNASNIILDSIDHMLNKVELDSKGKPTAEPRNACMDCHGMQHFNEHFGRITLVLI